MTTKEILSRNSMKPKLNKIKPKRIYGFDIETYGKNNTFLMGSIVNEKEKYVFWDIEEMRNFILGSNKIRGSRIFATNLGFDFMALFGSIHNNNKIEKDFEMLSKFKYIIRGSEFIDIKIRQSGSNCLNFSDTTNFFKVGVKVLGKIINVEKLKQPEFLGTKVDRFSKEGQELEKYNIRDSYISFKFAEFLQKSYNEMGCNMKYTVASTAMELFRNKYLKEKIIQPIKPILKLLFEGYYGGRVEAFFRGDLSKDKRKKFLYDINSLYPYVMQKYQYPHPNSITLSEFPSIDLIKKYEGLTYCEVNAIPTDLKYPDYPLLPFRDDGKLKFINGQFKGWYTNAELRKAIEIGYKIKPEKSIYYETNFNPFSEFITDLYNKRLEYKRLGNPLELPTKITMNSLYGKFAQKPIKSEILFCNIIEDINKINHIIKHNKESEVNGFDLRYNLETPDKNEHIDEFGNIITEPRFYYMQDLDSDDYAKFINPILSIYITSYARLELFSYFEKIIDNNKTLYYCDTDSILTDMEFPTSKKLGRLKLECEIDKGIIVKPKFYYIENLKTKENIIKSKGMSNLKELLEFKKVLQTKEYDYVKFTKFKESIRRKLPFNSILDVQKIITLEDDKRDWLGATFNMNELQESKPLFIAEFD